MPSANSTCGTRVSRLCFDRVAQMVLKLVLEPIFEVDFYPSSYGYRPGRRAQDAVAEVHDCTSRPLNYEWSSRATSRLAWTTSITMF
jgi:retron-type reverse transcriptase